MPIEGERSQSWIGKKAVYNRGRTKRGKGRGEEPVGEEGVAKRRKIEKALEGRNNSH